MMTLVRRALAGPVALALAAAALAGYAVPSRPATGRPGGAASSRAPSAAPPGPPQWVDVDVSTETEIAFTGDLVTASVSVDGSGDYSYAGKWYRAALAQATLDFGDGTEVVTQSCARPVPALTAGHVYHQAGTFAITVTAARFCSPGAIFGGDDGGVGDELAGTGPPLVILPSAPPGSGSWPPCAQWQVQISAGMANAAIGQRALLFTIRSVAGPDCAMFGYPGLVVVSPDGSLLQTDAQRGGDGGMFPAIPPHLVALAAGGTASFFVGYSNGAAYLQPNAPCTTLQDQAEIFLPGSYNYSLVGPAGLSFSDIACGSDFSISPVLPGPDSF
jgi:hypothetical protein